MYNVVFLSDNNKDFSKSNVSTMKYMRGIFYYPDSSVLTLPQSLSLDSATDISYCFANAYFTSFSHTLSNAITAIKCFYQCKSLTKFSSNNSSLIKANKMFELCEKLKK